MKEFKIKKHALPTPAQSYAQLVGNAKDSQIIEIPLHLIDEIDNQPHKIHEDKIESIAESINLVGQIDPVVVIEHPDDKGRYLLLSGRHRVRACEMLNKDTVKAVIITETNPDKQRFIIVSSNNDRNIDYLPSELAYSYLEQKRLLEKLGSKQTTAKIAEASGTNRKSVHKFIQLTNLINSLMHRVDKGELTVGAGYELSFMDTKDQECMNIYMINNPGTHIAKETARLIRENPKNIDDIISNANNATADAPVPFSTQANEIKSKHNPPVVAKQNNVSEPNGDERTVISYVLFTHLKYVSELIIKEFASTDDVVACLQEKCKTRSGYGGWVGENAPISRYRNKNLWVDFGKNKCRIRFDNKEFLLSLKTIDSLIREHIKTYLSTDKIIEIIKDR